MSEKQIRIIWFIILIGICAFLFISFLSYNPTDIPFNTSNPNIHIKNFSGYVGAYLVWALLITVGWSAYLIPLLFCLWAVGKILGRITHKFHTKFFGFLFAIWSFSAMMSTITAPYNVSRVATGGVVGFYTSLLFCQYFGEVGTMVILGTIFVLSILLATEFLVLPVLLRLSRALAAFFNFSALKEKIAEMRSGDTVSIKPKIRKLRSNKRDRDIDEEDDDEDEEEEEEIKPKRKSKIIIKKPKILQKKKKPPKISTPKYVGDYKLPPLDLLSSPAPMEERMMKDDLEGNSKILEETLRDFNIEVKVVEVEQGPVITRYELQPAPGVKINQIMNLGDDIALNLKAPSVHIVAPLPGKGTVGIDVPNLKAAMVYLKELLETNEFQGSKSKLTLALGKNINGSPLVTDLAAMPHMLIAGTTGAGKTVCVNTLIMSILFQASPEEVKMILIDPKMVEMATYNGLPHLICPVVNDVKRAAGALDWAVTEMENRYKLLAKVGARNIAGYNAKIEGGLKEITDGDKKIPLEKMPYIVIIIDELADMMLLAPKEVEGAITRLAQLSRAIGIHMILATQRPSVDVITGVIKANFPARISFRVASKIDSRTVLDMNGADKLLGRGDMLFLKPGNFKLVRAQSGLVEDKEIEEVVKFAKDQRTAVYTEDILKEQEKIFGGKSRDKKDDLYEEATKLVINTKQASVSMLQRRLRLGYARAARLIDMMEDDGIVGPFRGSKAREILIDNWDDAVFAQQDEE